MNRLADTPSSRKFTLRNIFLLLTAAATIIIVWLMNNESESSNASAAIDQVKTTEVASNSSVTPVATETTAATPDTDTAKAEPAVNIAQNELNPVNPDISSSDTSIESEYNVPNLASDSHFELIVKQFIKSEMSKPLELRGNDLSAVYSDETNYARLVIGMLSDLEREHGDIVFGLYDVVMDTLDNWSFDRPTIDISEDLIETGVVGFSMDKQKDFNGDEHTFITLEFK